MHRSQDIQVGIFEPGSLDLKVGRNLSKTGGKWGFFHDFEIKNLSFDKTAYFINTQKIIIWRGSDLGPNP
jgi:hypothetical protein